MDSEVLIHSDLCSFVHFWLMFVSIGISWRSYPSRAGWNWLLASVQYSFPSEKWRDDLIPEVFHHFLIYFLDGFWMDWNHQQRIYGCRWEPCFLVGRSPMKYRLNDYLKWSPIKLNRDLVVGVIECYKQFRERTGACTPVWKKWTDDDWCI